LSVCISFEHIGDKLNKKGGENNDSSFFVGPTFNSTH